MSKFAGLEIETEKPQRMVLLHPTSRQPLRDRDGKEAFIDLFSADSEQARRHNRAVQRRRLAMRNRVKITPEELEGEAIDLLSSLTTDWHLVTLAGEHIDIPFSLENARELYSEPKLAWIREQVDEFAADRGNFTQSSSQS